VHVSVSEEDARKSSVERSRWPLGESMCRRRVGGGIESAGIAIRPEALKNRGARRVAASFNFTLKLVRPGFGPAAELPRTAPA
jgi:hypothetical protein